MQATEYHNDGAIKQILAWSVYLPNPHGTEGFKEYWWGTFNLKIITSHSLKHFLFYHLMAKSYILNAANSL